MAQASFDTGLLNTIGINTSITIVGSAYQNYAQMINAMSYLGVTNIRDTYDNPYTIAEFARIASQLNIKFDFFIALGSVTPEWQIAEIEADPSIVAYVEGYNESDSWSQSFNGATGLAATAAVQAYIDNAVKSDPALNGVGVIQASFAQLTSFAAYGNNAANADYASTHTYFGTGNNPIGSAESIVALAQSATPGKPTITTEAGYHTTLGNVNGVSPLVQAKYELDLLFEQAQAGVKLTYLWELVDNFADPANTNSEDHFGLFNNDWTPKLAAIALHNTMQIMADPGTKSFAPGALNYTLGSLPSSVQTALYQKSDGTFVLVVWNDVRLSGPVSQGDIAVAPLATTLQLGQQFARISIFDPLTGTTSIQDFSNVSLIDLQVVDYPLIIELSQDPTFQAPHTIVSAPNEIITNPSQAVQVDGVSVASGSGMLTVQLQSATSGLSVLDATGHLLANQASSIKLSGSAAMVNAELASLTYTGGVAFGNDVITITTTDQSGTSSTKNISVLVEAGTTAINSGGPAVSVPSTFSSAAGTTSILPRFSVADIYAATHDGIVTLTVTAGSGMLQVAPGIGPVSGNSSSSLSVSGSWSQVVAALSALSYTAPGQVTEDSISVSVTDQAGFTGAGTTVVTVGPPPHNTPPTLTVSQSVSGTTTNNSNTLFGTVTDTGSGVAAVEIFVTTDGTSTDLGQATINGGNWSYTVKSLAPGTYTFSAVGFDKAGDTTAPILTGPAETVFTATSGSTSANPTPVVTPAQPPISVSINTIIGNRDGGVTLTGRSAANSVATISDTVNGTTTALGTATATASGIWSFTDHAKLNLATVNSFGVAASDSSGNSGAMSGRLILGSTQPDTLLGTAGTKDVFAIMSFKGADVINCFQSNSAVGIGHDVLDLSGRGISSFTQVQSMTTGTSSAIIAIGSGKTVTLTGVPSTALTAADFVFS